VNAQRSGRVPNGGLAITRQNLHLNAALPEDGNRGDRIWAQALSDGKDMTCFAILEGNDGSLRVPCRGYRSQGYPPRRTTACRVSPQAPQQSRVRPDRPLLRPRPAASLLLPRGRPRQRLDDGWRAPADQPAQIQFPGYRRRSLHRVPATSTSPSCRTRSGGLFPRCSTAMVTMVSRPNRVAAGRIRAAFSCSLTQINLSATEPGLMAGALASRPAAVARQRSEAATLSPTVNRLLLRRLGLTLAPGEHRGKDHEHRHHSHRNQHRIDRHSYLLLISSKNYANAKESSLIPIKLTGQNNGGTRFRRRQALPRARRRPSECRPARSLSPRRAPSW
jgi:hypothetical protein